MYEENDSSTIYKSNIEGFSLCVNCVLVSDLMRVFGGVLFPRIIVGPYYYIIWNQKDVMLCLQEVLQKGALDLRMNWKTLDFENQKKQPKPLTLEEFLGVMWNYFGSRFKCALQKNVPNKKDIIQTRLWV